MVLSNHMVTYIIKHNTQCLITASRYIYSKFVVHREGSIFNYFVCENMLNEAFRKPITYIEKKLCAYCADNSTYTSNK